MNVALTIKKLSGDNQRRLLLSGARLGVYVNVLHAVPFMWASEFFLVFALIALSAVTIPMAASAWNQKEPNPHNKTRQILKGLTASSAAFALIYLVETLAGNYAHKILATPMQFPISRAPHASLLISLVLIGLFSITILFLRRREIA